MRIVVAEDEYKTRKGIINLIQKLDSDYQVVGEAENGAVGLEIIPQLLPDLVIVDIKMPLVNGLEMLEKLKELGIKHRTVILSGFSDFEYAQKAIKIGVSEYLLKPITSEDLENTLRNIEKDIEEEKILESSQFHDSPSLEYTFRNLILANTVDDEMVAHLNSICRFSPDQEFAAVLLHFSDDSYGQVEKVKGLISRSLDRMDGCKYYLVELSVHHELVALMQLDKNSPELERLFQNKVLYEIRREGMKNIVLGWIPFSGLHLLKDSLNAMRKDLKWSIVLGDDILVSYLKTQHIHTELINYPVETENNIKLAVYSMDYEKIYKYVDGFLNIWREKLHKPEHVTEAFIRFASSMINAVKEIDYDLYHRINQKEKLKRIMDALTWEELKSVLSDVADETSPKNRKDGKVYSLTVKKALSLINENYTSGISLEEVSARLGITAEYLSTLFNKEVGQNFTAYIKETRIRKAKELLVSTSLKTYEVAETVGYTDPKYFSRVFKEITGLSPGDYQKANR